MVVFEAMSQGIWLRKILKDMGGKESEPTTINYDNKSTIVMMKNLMHHSTTKHMTIINLTFRMQMPTNMFLSF